MNRESNTYQLSKKCHEVNFEDIAVFTKGKKSNLFGVDSRNENGYFLIGNLPLEKIDEKTVGRVYLQQIENYVDIPVKVSHHSGESEPPEKGRILKI